MDVHPTKNGINRYWSIAICVYIYILHVYTVHASRCEIGAMKMSRLLRSLSWLHCYSPSHSIQRYPKPWPCHSLRCHVHMWHTRSETFQHCLPWSCVEAVSNLSALRIRIFLNSKTASWRRQKWGAQGQSAVSGALNESFSGKLLLQCRRTWTLDMVVICSNLLWGRPGSLWIVMDIYGWLFMDRYGSLFMDRYGSLWIVMDRYG
jgi:hypothetical protein